jgi:predicted RNase H-like HicB family nuclease
VTHYIAIIHKERDSLYGVSFPDVPGVVAAGTTIDEAIEQAAEVLAYAAEDWAEVTGARFPAPRSIDDLRRSEDFRQESEDAVVAAIPLRVTVAVN